VLHFWIQFFLQQPALSMACGSLDVVQMRCGAEIIRRCGSPVRQSYDHHMRCGTDQTLCRAREAESKN
jgi:hypothetical protein